MPRPGGRPPAGAGRGQCGRWCAGRAPTRRKWRPTPREEAACQRAVREAAAAAAAARPERGYTAPGPSHREPAAVWAEEPPEAGEQAKRLAEKAASLDAAAAAAAEKRAQLERETRARLKQLRNLSLGEAIGGVKWPPELGRRLVPVSFWTTLNFK